MVCGGGYLYGYWKSDQREPACHAGSWVGRRSRLSASVQLVCAEGALRGNCSTACWADKRPRILPRRWSLLLPRMEWT